ncbi:MAG TPA: hypothetical protein VFU71_21845 [Burkholderiaceae bacterium]|nr:hypothetical protein [Burkholderiaceae bacterium]
MSKSRLLAAAALVATGALGVGVAQAQETHVSWSITIGSPVPVLPLPAIVGPAPVVVQPAQVVVQPAPYYHDRRYHQPMRWDADGDGIPNRYDRLYNPAWDRDGDGIPNYRDHYDNRRHDRDGDIPNRYDRH